MSRRVWIGAAIAAAVVIAALFSCASAPAPKAEHLANPTVSIELNEEHGSGVFIGGGAILTAAHVVQNSVDGSVIVKTEDGRALFGWVGLVSKRDDVAIVMVENAKMRPAKLACRAAVKGEAVELEGNPSELRFIGSWGRVASSKAQKLDDWPNVIVTDLTAAPGSSGGPVFDARGEVIGILVGGMVNPMIVPFTFAVPSERICTLLGRKVS